MSNRYSTPGPWSILTDRNITTADGEPARVTVWTGPLVDSRGGYRYEEGAHKVEIHGPVGRPRTKTFKGETAWSKAEMYAYDAVNWLNRH